MSIPTPISTAAGDTRPSARFVTGLARTDAEVVEAQRLRYDVYRASLPPEAHALGLDRDAFDPHCRHLLVRDTATDAVVGTYRILGRRRARRGWALLRDGVRPYAAARLTAASSRSGARASIRRIARAR